jgi:hypothetical protein
MAQNKLIRVDELDFDAIKSNIKTFLQGQETFKDYNFEGSALTILLDILAYNTHYNALYTNMAVNEMFLDSASKYSSAVSLAKMVGYTAFSVTSAQAKIQLTVRTPVGVTPSGFIVPRGTEFAANINDIDYVFSTVTDYSAPRLNSQYNFTLDIVEGVITKKFYTVGSATKFVIPNRLADIRSLNIKVQLDSNSSIFTQFNLAEDVLNIRGTDRVYFVKQREDLYYEVYFGDDIIGKSVDDGNIIHMEYIVSAGVEANGAADFVYRRGLGGNNIYFITPISQAAGGANAETLESIKLNAPRTFISQNRAVTTSDYETLINSSMPNIESVKVWGGQDNIPRVYGKVYIAAKPYNSDLLLDQDKEKILSMLSKKKIITMVPELVDPYFLRIEYSVSVYYNPRILTRTPGQLLTSLQAVIQNYAITLNKFDSSFRFSQLSRAIDTADNSIISNIATLRVRSPVSPKYNVYGNYDRNFGNPISRDSDLGGTFYSTRFLEVDQEDRCFIKDNGAGVLQLIVENTQGVPRYLRDIGTINYDGYSISIPKLNIRGLYDPELEFVFIPKSNDVISVRQYIVSLPNDLMELNIIVDQSSAGNSNSGSNHIFSASR